VRRLIVNADDFGLTSGVNRAIAQAHRDGLVTSATLMANASAFAEAATLARGMPTLSVGCHIVLIDGAPLSPASSLGSLVENDAFGNSLGRFAWRALRGRLNEEQIEAEATAQIRRLQSAGIEVSHIDTHKHTHMFPAVLRPLLRAARSCGVPAIRNPFVPLRPLAFAHLVRRPRLWTRYSEVRILASLANRFRRAVQDAGMVTTDGSFGVVSTGALDLRLFEAIIGCIPEGTWEFVCHPGYNDADLGRTTTRLRASREKELQVLTSAEARRAIERRGIELISYRELVRSAKTESEPQLRKSNLS
jgi:hopanoid biosynthesis associated protein HpnK